MNQISANMEVDAIPDEEYGQFDQSYYSDASYFRSLDSKKRNDCSDSVYPKSRREISAREEVAAMVSFPKDIIKE
jgi:hypothetical protein